MAANSRRSKMPSLDISAPKSMRRAGKITTILLVCFCAGLVYLTYTLVSQSSYYMAKSGSSTYGIVYDRTGDVLFDGTQPLTAYPAGQFSDVGNLIGDVSGQMTNTLVAKNISELANYSFSYGTRGGSVSLRTTLSHAANKAIYQALGKKNGTAIAFNWKTGEVLVCVSKPCVDIAKGYDNLDSMPEGSLLCKAFYPTVPGSTQKVATLVAAYEHNGISAVNGTEFTCTGSWTNAQGQQINCHEKGGHGTQTLQQAFENSCNPYFAQLVQSDKLPLSALVDTYTQMGYAVNGEAADTLTLDGITIEPASTTLTDTNDFNTQWGALGQGETLVSPFQMALWEGAIASGSGRVLQPFLIDSKTGMDGREESLSAPRYTKQFFPGDVAQAVREVMVTNAKNHYYVSLGNYNCGVKSGTAQVTEDGKEYENSFLTGFCLDDSCPVAFCVMIEHRVSSDITSAQLTKVLLDALNGKI